jgi:hypothetical protein
LNGSAGDSLEDGLGFWLEAISSSYPIVIPGRRGAVGPESSFGREFTALLPDSGFAPSVRPGMTI